MHTDLTNVQINNRHAIGKDPTITFVTEHWVTVEVSKNHNQDRAVNSNIIIANNKVVIL